VSPPVKHPLIASTWTSESRPRAPCAVLVEHSRHELEQHEKSHGLSYAVFNTRVTSSRRSEVVSSLALSLLREYSASPLCPHEEPRARQRPRSPRPDPEGQDRRSSMHIEARLEASRRPSPTPWLRRASRTDKARTRPPRRRLTSSGRRPGSEDPDLELPTRSGAPRSTIDRPTRGRATPPEEPLPPGDSAPHPEGRHTAPPWAPPIPRGTLHQTLRPRADPKITAAPRAAPAIRRRPRLLASLPPSPRTPSQHQPRHAAPKDEEAREANALRPCGPIS